MYVVIVVLVHTGIIPTGLHGRFDLSGIGIAQFVLSDNLQPLELVSGHEHVSHMGLFVDQFQRFAGVAATTVRSSSGNLVVIG